MNRLQWTALIVVAAAVVPYLPTLDNYFVQDDFGVVALLSDKPATFFPRWFTIPWMEDIWGFVPDEVRPFPALTYQLAGQFGAGSPTANHVINIAFHALNALLVVALARGTAGLTAGPATFAGLVFAVLPMQSESVAWVTGRVDSMPACFYLLAFLLYARWRRTSRRADYGWSLAVFFVALYTKQNTVTMVATLAAFDLLVLGRRPRLSWNWARPYLPFAVMTAVFLGHRYVLFGAVAREGSLTAHQLGVFLSDASVHLRRMVFGEWGLSVSLTTAMVAVAAVAGAIVAIRVRWRSQSATIHGVLINYGLVWIAVCLAPTIVAGYASPRHMYLASAGWALALGVWVAALRDAAVPRSLRIAGTGLACAVLAGYGFQLRDEIARWEARAALSNQAVEDVEREARLAPPGTLIVAGAPRLAWDFALPHAIRPPFTAFDVTSRARVISHSSIHCCPANVWEPYTRALLRDWAADPARPPAIVLHWDLASRRLSRLGDDQDPFVRSLVGLLEDTPDAANLDRLMLDVVNRFAARPHR